MKATFTQQFKAFLATFTLSLFYLLYTQSLKTDSILYTNTTNLLSYKIIYIDHPPLVELLFYYLICIGHFFNSLFLTFNIFTAFLMALNILLIFATLNRHINQIESIFLTILYFAIKDVHSVFVINRFVVQLNLFLMYLNGKKLKSIFLGLLMAANQIAFLFYGFEIAKKIFYTKRKSKNTVNFLVPPLIYITTFLLFISKLRFASKDSEKFTIEFTGTFSAEPCDKYVLDRALVTLINQKNHAYVTANIQDTNPAFGNKLKTEESIFEVIKVHIENSPLFDISSPMSMYFRDKDYLKLKHYKSNKLLSCTVKDSKDKFNEVFLSEEDNESCLWQLFFDKKSLIASNATLIINEQATETNLFVEEKLTQAKEPFIFIKNQTNNQSNQEYLQSRTTLFRLKHTSTGTELNIKSDLTLATSTESLFKTRFFYIEDCYNNNYYKYNLKDKRIKEKILSFPKLNLFFKFLEYNCYLINELGVVNVNLGYLVVAVIFLIVFVVLDLMQLRTKKSYFVMYTCVLIGEIYGVKSGLCGVIGVFCLAVLGSKVCVWQRWCLFAGCMAFVLRK